MFGEKKDKFAFANWNDVPLTQLKLDGGFTRSPWQSKYFMEVETNAFKRLKESIKRDGMRVPVLAVKNGEGITLLAGFRRVKIAIELGWDSVPARVHPGPLTDAQQEWIVIDDNVSRRGGEAIIHGSTRQSLSTRIIELIREIDPSLSQEIQIGSITAKGLRERTGMSTWASTKAVSTPKKKAKEALVKSRAIRYPSLVDRDVMKVVQRSTTVIVRNLRHANKATVASGISVLKNTIRELNRLE